MLMRGSPYSSYNYCVVMQKLYEEKVGSPDLIELVKGSAEVDTASFLPQKVSK